METQTQTQSQELQIQEEAQISVLNSAPEILMKNQASKEKATKAYESLEAKIIVEGMSPFFDEQLKNFTEKGKTTLKAINSSRTPITQALDLVKKQFTTIESDLKAIIDKAQKRRDDYASEVMREQKKREEEARSKVEKENEAIDLKRILRQLYNQKLSSIRATRVDELINWFNALVLSKAPEEFKAECLTFIDDFASLTKTEVISKSFVDTQNLNDNGISFKPKHHDLEAIKIIAKDVYTSLIDPFMLELNADINLNKQSLKDRLPSKIAELEELSLADAQEAARILAEKQKREAEEAEKRAKEDADKKAAADAAANIQAAGEKAAATIDATLFNETPKVVESYNIKITNRAAWGLIFQFWFEKEGKTLTDDKLEAFTLKRMKAFCEKWAKDNGEKISSPGIAYEEIYKAK